MNKLHEIDFNITENDNGLLVEKQQIITDDFVQGLKDARNGSLHRRAGEYHRAASIPTIIVEKWMKEGYNVFEEPVRKTLAKLKNESLDYFITTDKQL